MTNFALNTNGIDIWQIGFESVDGNRLQRLRELLSPDEIQRADRFYFERDRRRFAVARAAMRWILGQYAHVPPQNLVFAYGPKGKPELSGPVPDSGIAFNLSHSGEFAMLAITNKLTVGVDIEFIKPDFGGNEIAERFFSANEVARLQSLPASQQAEAFFSCWTRKEAYIKAIGDGLYVPLDSFEVAFGPDVPAELLVVKTDPREVSRWSMYNLEAPPGYKAALVAEGKGHNLRRILWQGDREPVSSQIFAQ